jgi:hypothetical protein
MILPPVIGSYSTDVDQHPWQLGSTVFSSLMLTDMTAIGSEGVGNLVIT